MLKVYLGGVEEGSTWRERLMLRFDPESIESTLDETEDCDYYIYTYSPIGGCLSNIIAEAVDSSNKRPEKTIFCILNEDYNQKAHEMAIRDKKMHEEYPGRMGYYPRDLWEWGHPLTWCGTRPKEYKKVEEIIMKNGSFSCRKLIDIVEYLTE